MKARTFGLGLAPHLGLSSLAFAAQDELEIIHSNIGQGDSTLIIGPEQNGKHISVLIDAGDRFGPDGGEIIHGLLKDRGIKTLDMFIATHYDADHIGGVASWQARRIFVGGRHEQTGGECGRAPADRRKEAVP